MPSFWITHSYPNPMLRRLNLLNETLLIYTVARSWINQFHVSVNRNYTSQQNKLNLSKAKRRRYWDARPSSHCSKCTVYFSLVESSHQRKWLQSTKLTSCLGMNDNRCPWSIRRRCQRWWIGCGIYRYMSYRLSSDESASLKGRAHVSL